MQKIIIIFSIFLVACHHQPKTKNIAKGKVIRMAVFKDNEQIIGELRPNSSGGTDTVYDTWRHFDSDVCAKFHNQRVRVCWPGKNHNIQTYTCMGDSIYYYDSLYRQLDDPRTIQWEHLPISSNLVHSGGPGNGYLTSWGQNDSIAKLYFISPHNRNCVQLYYEDLRSGTHSTVYTDTHPDSIAYYDKLHHWHND